MATKSSVLALIRAYHPRFRNAHNKVTFALNASFLAAGYVLTATGNRAFSASPPSNTGEEVGIDGWNELDDCYGFIYKKAEGGSKKFVIVKCLVMGKNLVIDTMCHGEEKRKPFNLQINVNYFVSDEASSSTNYEKIYKNFPSLVDRLQSRILDKLENTVKQANQTILEIRSVPKQHEDLDVDILNLYNSEANQTILHIRSVPKHHEDLDVGILTEPQPYPPGGGFGIGRGIGGGMLVGPNHPRWHGQVGRAQPGFRGGLPNPRRPGCGGGGHPDTQHFPGGHDYYL